MNINRHNYEELFLLYVDNELSAADRKAVEMFVKENTDLKMELDLLQQTVLKADDIVLDKKDWLYMEEEISALQEDLLLYADNELSGIDKKLVEGLIHTDKAARAEWNILQQTILQPDTTVVFEDKASLYRREAGRVIAIKWWRVAAAAVLLGFGIWTGVSVYNNSFKTNTRPGEMANNGQTNSTETITTVPANKVTVIAETENRTTAENVLTTAPENNTVQNKTNIDAVEQNKNRASDPTSQNNIAVQNSKKQDNNLPRPERNRAEKSTLQNINSTNSNENIVAGVQPLKGNNSKVSGNIDEVTRINTTSTNTINRADQPVAVVQVSNTETEDNSRYLNIDDKQKRTALGGLIRKAKRVVERTTNINTGEGVKIAGFEIALK